MLRCAVKNYCVKTKNSAEVSVRRAVLKKGILKLDGSHFACAPPNLMEMTRIILDYFACREAALKADLYVITIFSDSTIVRLG